MIYQSLKILLVEDVAVIAKITEQMLKKASAGIYGVTVKATLSDALAALRTEEFDITLLDLNLPDSSDLKTLTDVVTTAPDTPVIVLTANESDEIGVQAVKLGAQDFLVKGNFNDSLLKRAILYAIERHRLQSTIRQLAIIDELTGLYNRRGFSTLHSSVYRRVQETRGRGFLCYFDLDRFKQINDQLGHKVGDEALVEFAAHLRAVFRKDALIFRLGGDEFVAMGVEHSAGQTEETLQALEVVLSVRNTMGVKSAFSLETSAGMTFFSAETLPAPDALLAEADALLYANKKRRRGPNYRREPELQPVGTHG